MQVRNDGNEDGGHDVLKTLRRRLAARLTLATIAALASSTLAAHHSFAMYDQSIKYVFTGVVERINPDGAHLQIVFVPLNEQRDALVRDASGKPATWLVEMGGSAASRARRDHRQQLSARHRLQRRPRAAAEWAARRSAGRRTLQCPKGKPPAAGMHCDSVEGATSHGGGGLAKPTATWKP